MTLAPPRQTGAVNENLARWLRAGADAAVGWLRPLGEPEPWRCAAYLGWGLFLGPVALALAVALLAGALSLLILVVGIPLTVLAFRCVDHLTRPARAGAAWIGAPIGRRPLAPHRGAGLRAFRTVMADPARWRQIGFFATDAILAPLAFVAALLPLAVCLELILGADLTDIEWLPGGLLGGVLGFVGLGVVPRAWLAIAATRAHIHRWFLGPDELAAMSQRVSTLATQRQDVLDAVAVERRRIERNLHDGVQQQLIAIGLDLGMALDQLDRDTPKSRALILQARQKLQGSIGELRQLGRGLHPAILGDRGLDAALSAVIADSPIPVSVHVDPALDLSTDTAEVAYFVANEAMANVLKHAQARVASIHVVDLGPAVRITVHDDGVGSADPSNGTGLAGLRARVVAMDGTFSLSSPDGGPTTLVVEVPHRG